MKGLLNSKGRHVPARFLSQRRLAFATIGVVTTLSLAPCGAFALNNATIPLSRMVAKSILVSPMDPANEITIQFTLPLADRKGARELLKHVSTPKDPLFHHYITAQEFASRFGANAEDYSAVRAWAIANGLSIVHEAIARNSLTLRGTVAQVQTLFKTQLNFYKAPSGDQFYSASVAPTVPNELVSKIQALVGLTGGVQKAALYKIGKMLGENPVTPAVRADTPGGTGPGGAYSASDLRKAYSIPKFGGASPQTVAVFEDSPLVASDFAKYLSTNKLPAITLKQISVDGAPFKPSSDQVEAVLDVDMIAAINPDVKEIQVYYAPEIQGFSAYSTDLIDVFDQVAKAASGANGPQTLSVSYGLDENDLENNGGDIDGEADQLVELDLAGVTVLASSGDQGAYGRSLQEYPSEPIGLNVEDPGSQPFVTCVGGTTLFTDTNQHYRGEEAWNGLGLGDGATGGGYSVVWSISGEVGTTEYDYQQPLLIARNGGNPTQRNIPDVAAVADPLTGVGIYVKSSGGWMQIGGTSASSPIWAGYVSILNSAAQYLLGTTQPVIGFFNPLLYAYSTYDNAPAGTLYQIYDGSNGNIDLYGIAGYNAGESYNDCCGLGSIWGPSGFQALWVLANVGTTPSPTVTTPPPTVTISATPSARSAKIKWTPSTGATGYAIFVQLEEITTGPKYVPVNFAKIGITKKTSFDVTGLLPEQLIAIGGGKTAPIYQYQVFVAAVDSAGTSLSGPYYFFTKL